MGINNLVKKVNVEEITEIAADYLKKTGTPFFKIESVKFESGQWNVVADVGTFQNKFKSIIIDDDGKGISYG